LPSFSFYREKNNRRQSEHLGTELSQWVQNERPYGSTTPNVKPPAAPRDNENTSYVAVPSMDVEEGDEDNSGRDHYDLCFVAKLENSLTKNELDALGKQENGGRAAPLDDSLIREIRGPLTGPLQKSEPHHAPLHQVDDLVERMHSVGLETRKCTLLCEMGLNRSMLNI
jgi:hypothetical protein